MRILVVVHGGAGSRVTGPEIRGWAMARALAERHEVTVAVHDPPAPTSADGLRLVPFDARDADPRGAPARRRRRAGDPAVPVRRAARQPRR